MSRCKRHTTDLSSTVGVCASCLRERLFAIMAAQAQAQLLQQTTSEQHHHLNFPRSVSPYITRRKSDTTTSAGAKWQLPNGHDVYHRWFYSTPQVDPNGSVTLEVRRDQKQSRATTKKKKLASMFSGFFRSKQSDSLESSESTSSWLTSVFSKRRRNKKKKMQQNKTFSLDDSSSTATTTSRVPGTRVSNRGMSPARRSSDNDEEEHGDDGSSGESTESTSWRRLRLNSTPAANSSSTRRRTAASSCRNAPTGFAFCLSPLVRASPNHRNWSPEVAIGGDSSSSRASHLSSATSFCKSRSRKLADFGRYNSYSGKCNR